MNNPGTAWFLSGRFIFKVFLHGYISESGVFPLLSANMWDSTEPSFTPLLLVDLREFSTMSYLQIEREREHSRNEYYRIFASICANILLSSQISTKPLVYKTTKGTIISKVQTWMSSLAQFFLWGVFLFICMFIFVVVVFWEL